ncbi:hypothetical protein PIB30_017734 [Stylosanthes scabra]|uniref:Uncharacterized protein n=1 Tax=Stylosanthes scabra TaxID=79078 RepID=A0ABU6S7V5_9FABA|nr:hypothetical protein [Stylosanthes scabra]
MTKNMCNLPAPRSHIDTPSAPCSHRTRGDHHATRSHIPPRPPFNNDPVGGCVGDF